METLSLPDGGCLAYRDEGAGPTIVLVHGWGVCSGFFNAQLSALSDSHRVVVPDLRGHGGSSVVPPDRGFSVLADDLQALMNALELSEAVIVGWSMGAMVAWDLLSRYGSQRVAGLISVDIVPRILNDGSWTFGLRKGRDASVFDRSLRSMREDWPAFTRVFIPRIFARGDAIPRNDMESLYEMAADNDPQSMARLWAAMAIQDFRRQVSQIDIPVLVLFGEHSRLYRPEASAWLVENIPQGRRVAFSRSGHAPHLEEPETFTQIVTQFARQVGTGGQAGAEVPVSSGKQSHDGGSSA